MKKRVYSPMLYRILSCGLFALVIFISGCSGNQDATPAPLGKLSALENLADSYTQISEQFPMNVGAMPPPQKREFLEHVFKKTGYDYSATIIHMSNSTLDKNNKNQKDLAELVLLPTVGISNDAASDFYSDDEMQAIHKIKTELR